MKILNLSWMSLDEIPDNIYNLRDLEEFYLGDNLYGDSTDPFWHNVSLISKSLGQLNNLQVLKIDCHPIRQLPHTITNLQKLEILSLYACELYELPNNIGNLKNLIFLNLSCNNLTSLPNNICNLKKLQALILSNNGNLYLNEIQKE
ncbi:leucine-rich repeat domain-containing protein [Aliarcobacter butzleri]|uniref:leucine-rich repeat domain-containing protein n=1 Tax=Aliarcobacter butzleri TaxID=28197 RepID=UPI003AF73F83